MSTVTGWGLTAWIPKCRHNASDGQPPIVSRQVASQVGRHTRNVIMAGYNNGNKDACSGDSGGPLVVPVGDEGFKVAGL